MRWAALAAVMAAACHRDPPKRETVPETALGSGPPSKAAAAAAAPSATGYGACTLARTAWRFPAVERVVAFGDVHGDLGAARAALKLAGAIDDRDQWVGGTLWVVQTGDVLDRGGDEQAILDWFERLEPQAQAAGGRFVWLLGNHELMNAAGDLRYVTEAGFRDFEDVPGLHPEAFARAPEAVRARLAAFTPGGPYAKILGGQNYVAIVGDTAFVHGGIGPGKAAGLDDDTLAARCWLVGQGPPPAALTDTDGPVWDRSFAQGPTDCAALDRALGELGVKRMVVGHTVQEHGVTSACDGKIWRIDVGLAALYGGPREALELRGATATILGR